MSVSSSILLMSCIAFASWIGYNIFDASTGVGTIQLQTGGLGVLGLLIIIWGQAFRQDKTEVIKKMLGLLFFISGSLVWMYAVFSVITIEKTMGEYVIMGILTAIAMASSFVIMYEVSDIVATKSQNFKKKI